MAFQVPLKSTKGYQMHYFCDVPLSCCKKMLYDKKAITLKADHCQKTRAYGIIEFRKCRILTDNFCTDPHLHLFISVTTTVNLAWHHTGLTFAVLLETALISYLSALSLSCVSTKLSHHRLFSFAIS